MMVFDFVLTYYEPTYDYIDIDIDIGYKHSNHIAPNCQTCFKLYKSH